MYDGCFSIIIIITSITWLLSYLIESTDGNSGDKPPCTQNIVPSIIYQDDNN